MRVFFYLFFALFISYLAILALRMDKSEEKPIFLRTDEIADQHDTTIDLCVESVYQPSEEEILILKSDYKNLWAHLNHLYATNDLLSGKEYYTERWFNQHGQFVETIKRPFITRQDLFHELSIKNWSSDGLVCTAIDHNVLLEYTLPNEQKATEYLSIALVLLFQGDHWRIDAIRMIASDEPTGISQTQNCFPENGIQAT